MQCFLYLNYLLLQYFYNLLLFQETCNFGIVKNYLFYVNHSTLVYKLYLFTRGAQERLLLMRKYKSDYSRTAYLISRCTKSWSWHEHISYLFRIFAQANENTVSVFTKMWAKTENSEEKILFFRKYCHPNFKYLQPLHTDYHIKACKHQAFFSNGPSRSSTCGGSLETAEAAVPGSIRASSLSKKTGQ